MKHNSSHKLLVTSNLVLVQGKGINLGREVSSFISKLPNHSKLGLKVNDFINKLLQSAGGHILLYNLGILFEEELKLNVVQLLSAFSQNSLLVIEWKGEIEGKTLYFLTNHKGKKIDLSHIGFEYLQTYEV